MFDFTNTEASELVERRQAIGTECETASGEALSALEAELDAINAEMATRKAAEEKRQEIRNAVANGAGEVIAEYEIKERKMDIIEVRNSPAYIEAYAKYVRSGDDKECRAILTETNPGSVSGSGPVPVPTFVDETVRHAWENNQILARVRKTNIRGNLKIGFERSADAANVHTEGTTAPSEESLTLGIVTMIPANIKKWIKISDEAEAMGGEAFLRYVYEELTYRVIKKLADLVVTDIASASSSHSSSAVGVPQVSAAPGVGSIAKAMGYLSDEAANLCVIMNKLTWSAFKEAEYAGNFAVDVFEGCAVLFSDALPAYASANDNATYAVVGDLSGAQVNYPEGEGVVLKYDDLSEAESDLVKIVARQYAAHAVTGPGKFVNLTKPAAATT